MKTQISKQHTNAVAVQPLTTFHKEDRMKNQSSTMSLLKKSLLAAAIMAFAIMPATISAQCSGGSGANHIVNGGFQTGYGSNITGWRVAWPFSVDSLVFINGSGQGGSSQALWMGSTAGHNTISQSIPGLTANAVYTLCFYLANNSSSGPGSFSVNWDGNVVLLEGSNAPFGYQYYSFEVLARGGSNDIVSFEERNPPSYYLLDNVWLQTCVSGCSIGLSDEGATKARPIDSE